MATAAVLLRRTTKLHLHHRALTTNTTTEKPTHHHKRCDHQSENHDYLKPTPFIGSFLIDDVPQNPKEAYAKLARLRRDYDKQVSVIRKQFIDEMELKRMENARKAEARQAEMLKQKEERKKLKAAAALVRAAELKTSQDELRLTLAKERAQKLEYWRERQNAIAEKKKKAKELICQQSSEWIDANELERRILQSITDSKIL